MGFKGDLRQLKELQQNPPPLPPPPPLTMALLSSLFEKARRSKDPALTQICLDLLALPADQGPIQAAAENAEKIEGQHTFSLAHENAFTRAILDSEVAAKGTLLWAMNRATEPDFLSSPSYANFAAGFVMLTRVVAQTHAALQPASFDLATAIFEQKPVIEEDSITAAHAVHEQTRKIKEACCELFVFVLAEGHVLEVLNYVTATDDMDVSLTRYFAARLLEMVAPPFSKVFSAGLGRLLAKQQVKVGLTSEHFGGKSKKLLGEAVAGVVQAGGLDSDQSKALKDFYVGGK